MGSLFSSKFEERNESIDDFNLLSVNFIGGQERILSRDQCPVDKLWLNYLSKKSELPDGQCKETFEILKINGKSLKFEDDAEAEATVIVKEILKFLQNVIDHLESI